MLVGRMPFLELCLHQDLGTWRQAILTSDPRGGKKTWDLDPE